jgi:hypothetical protein
MQVPQVPPLDAPMSGGFVLKAFYLWAHCSEWGSGGSPGSAARRSCSDGNRKGVHEALEVCSYPPLVRGLFDTIGDRHAKVGHPIEDRTSDSRLRLLIGQSPGVKASPNDGLVAEHCRFNEAPSAIA